MRHWSHEVCPASDWKEPLGQTSHLACPGDALNVPAAQAVATRDPIEAYEPAGTASHVLLASRPGWLELVPAGQSVVVTAPSGQ